jgi:glycosyltransferase involved in cell wall biosynthesis
MPHITTLHGRLDIPDLIPLYEEFHEMPVVSISNSQRKPLPWINWQGTVYHGLPKNLYTFRKGTGKYLAFLGRISPEKRVDRAIEIAKRAGMEIRIAAKVDAVDKEYFKTVIKPLFKHSHVKYLGEIGEDEKDEFLGDAYALLFPIDWPEPFGMVMIEAMACGTPVIAYRKGSVPEVIEDGVTGFIVENVGDAVKALEERIPTLSRKQCRKVFEEKFSATRMAEDYIKVYQQLLNKTIPVLEEGHINNGRDYPNQRPVLYSSNIIPD